MQRFKEENHTSHSVLKKGRAHYLCICHYLSAEHLNNQLCFRHAHKHTVCMCRVLHLHVCLPEQALAA